MPLRPTFKRPQWGVKKTVAIGVVGAELLGFAFAREATMDINTTIAKGIGNTAVWILDVPLENAVCSVTSLSPNIDFDGDCVQNFFKDKNTNPAENSPQPQTPTPEQPAANTPESPQISNLNIDINLVSAMSAAGYNCSPDTQTVKTAHHNDGPISLLGDTDAANAANAKGAFSGIVVHEGDEALVAICT